MNAYAEKLKDPRWQKKRLEILNRDNFSCSECNNKTDQLQVHHCYYVKNRSPWNYPNFSLMTLCSKCHSNKYNEEDTGITQWEEAINFIMEGDKMPLQYEGWSDPFWELGVFMDQLRRRGILSNQILPAFFKQLAKLWKFSEGPSLWMEAPWIDKETQKILKGKK